MYKHILFATELPGENHQVEDRVASLSQLTDARLSIIHVVESLPTTYAAGEIGINYNYRKDNEELMANAKEMLLPSTERMLIAPEDIIVTSGRVAKEVLNYAKQNNVDLIIVGSHGRHGLQLLLGSTANSILHGAKCDVLAVRLNE